MNNKLIASIISNPGIQHLLFIFDLTVIRDKTIARNSSSPEFDIIKNAERNSIDCQVQLCVIKANWVFMMGQNNSSQYNSRRWPEIFSQLTSHISSFLSFQLSNNKRYHRCKCLKKVLRMENRQLKFKTNNPVGKQYHQQLEGTSSLDSKLSVLSWRERGNN